MLEACIESLHRQTRRDFEIIVVDNSGQDLVDTAKLACPVKLIANQTNRGYGAAVNQAMEQSRTPYLAVLNDDASVAPEWLDRLVRTMESDSEVGMCACRVLLAGQNAIDSAGMLLCADGSSKQRGFGEPAGQYPEDEPALLPSGSAALYSRHMLHEIGGFDERFFLYCEDTDVGLRAIWAGWRCRYVAGAIVHHHYSQTAGAASPLKAYLVERNRLFVLIKNFPSPMLWRTPLRTLERYFWHLEAMLSGKGAAARYRQEHTGWPLIFIVFRAHASMLKHLWRLLGQRRRIRRSARISPAEFRQLCERFAITPRQVAAQ